MTLADGHVDVMLMTHGKKEEESFVDHAITGLRHSRFLNSLRITLHPFEFFLDIVTVSEERVTP